MIYIIYLYNLGHFKQIEKIVLRVFQTLYPVNSPSYATTTYNTYVY